DSPRPRRHMDRHSNSRSGLGPARRRTLARFGGSRLRRALRRHRPKRRPPPPSPACCPLHPFLRRPIRPALLPPRQRLPSFRRHATLRRPLSHPPPNPSRPRLRTTGATPPKPSKRCQVSVL